MTGKNPAYWWIEHLNLSRHPEGGYYRETYRSGETVRKECLPERFGSGRNLSTAIYFLLENGDFSSFHRIKADEIWHFYRGDPAFLYLINEDGYVEILKLGPGHEKGEALQVVVPRDTWFAAQSNGPHGFTLLGCTVAPGFDFEDFELATAEELSKQYPAHAALIQRFTRQ